MLIQTNDDWQQNVHIMPLTQLFNQRPELVATEGPQWKQFEEKRVVVSEDHDRLFGVFSKKAVIVRHTELVESLQLMGQRLYGEDLPLDVQSLDEGAKIIARLTLPDKYQLDVGNGDLSDMYLLAQNSYDHGYSFRLNIGVFRLVCTNGAVVGRTIDEIKAKEFVTRLKANTARLDRLVQKGADVVELWKTWMDVEIPRMPAELLLERYFPRKFYEPLLANATFPMSKYALYNLLTRRSTHDIADSKARWGVDNIIARLFYSPKLDQLAADYHNEINMPVFADEMISDSVTETDDITH